MFERNLTELNLRGMLWNAREARPDPIPGRWRIMASRRGSRWIIVVEPDTMGMKLRVITAYEG